MSKSALYAGLGKGLMSLGQGVSNAIQTMTIEDMRKQNLEQNWARQDAMRKEDQVIRKAENDDNQAIRKAENDDNQAWRETTHNNAMEYRKSEQESTAEWRKQQNEIAKQNADGLMKVRNSQVDSKGYTEKVITEGDHDYLASIDKEGNVISKKIIAPAGQFNATLTKSSSKLPEKIKLQYKSMSDEVKAIIEVNGEHTPESRKIQAEMGSLLGYKAESQAPQRALDALKNDPSLLDQFVNKYGYKPAGYN